MASPKLVVEVRNDECPSMVVRQVVKDSQKHHRIKPTGHGNQNGLPVSKKPSGANHLVNGFNQFVHPLMLLSAHREASDLSAK